jgi:hypothetical protein
MHNVPIPAHIFILFVEQEVRYISLLFYFHQVPCLESTNVQIVGDDTSALGSVLKAGVWREHLLSETVRLNARLAELDTTPPGELDSQLEEMRDEAGGRLAVEVHAGLADMDAERWPARAIALLSFSWRVVYLLCEAMSRHLIQIRSWI